MTLLKVFHTLNIQESAYISTLQEEGCPSGEEMVGGSLVTVEGEVNLKTSTGELMSLSALHAAIQANQERQLRLYQTAMSLWR
jgi:hypothetical protein